MPHDSHREFKSRLYAQFARVGHAVSSPKRIEILDLLGQGEKTVEQLADQTATPIKNTSAHLRALRQAGLVETRKDGPFVYYRLADASVHAFVHQLQALAHARFAEIIPDLLHVHPGAIRAALRSIPCLYCVTDSTAATGMPDGEYKLGRQPVTKCLGGVRLADGTRAGSTLTIDRALRNLVDVVGLALDDAARRVSTYPADFLELPDRGRLAAGAWGDVVVLDGALRVQEVFVEGGAIDVAHAG